MCVLRWNQNTVRALLTQSRNEAKIWHDNLQKKLIDEHYEDALAREAFNEMTNELERVKKELVSVKAIRDGLIQELENEEAAYETLEQKLWKFQDLLKRAERHIIELKGSGVKA